MFVQIIKGDGKKMTRECGGADVNVDGDHAVITIQPEGHEVRMLKAGTKVFLVNNEGRTIDSYRW